MLASFVIAQLSEEEAWQARERKDRDGKLCSLKAFRLVTCLPLNMKRNCLCLMSQNVLFNRQNEVCSKTLRNYSPLKPPTFPTEMNATEKLGKNG